MSLTTLENTDGIISMLNHNFEPWNEWLEDGFMGKAVTMPKVNIIDDKSNYSLAMLAPGLHKEDFKIDIDGGMLTISSENELSKEVNLENYVRREFNYSSFFSRSFQLPDEVMLDQINATYEGGILKLAIPKAEKPVNELHKAINVS